MQYNAMHAVMSSNAADARKVLKKVTKGTWTNKGCTIDPCSLTSCAGVAFTTLRRMEGSTQGFGNGFVLARFHSLSLCSAHILTCLLWSVQNSSNYKFQQCQLVLDPPSLPLDPPTSQRDPPNLPLDPPNDNHMPLWYGPMQPQWRLSPNYYAWANARALWP